MEKFSQTGDRVIGFKFLSLLFQGSTFFSNGKIQGEHTADILSNVLLFIKVCGKFVGKVPRK